MNFDISSNFVQGSHREILENQSGHGKVVEHEKMSKSHEIL